MSQVDTSDGKWTVRNNTVGRQSGGQQLVSPAVASSCVPPSATLSGARLCTSVDGIVGMEQNGGRWTTKQSKGIVPLK